MKRLIVLLVFLASTSQAELIPILAGDNTFILPDICLYSSTDGVAQVTVDSEDAGLVIRLTSDDGTTALVYDVATEIETIVTNYTYSTPSANNVRFKVQVNGCHQLMFAANSLDDGTIWSSLTIRDTSAPAFMDYDAKLFYAATQTDAEAASTTAMVALGLDHAFNQAMLDSDVADNSFVALLMSKSATADQTSYDNETDSLEAVRDLLAATDGKVDTAQLDLDDLTAGLILATGVSDSGSTITVVDAALIQADTDYWRGAAIVFTDNTDTVIGQSRCVTAFTPASDQLTFFPAATQAITTSAYSLVFSPTCRDIATAQSDLDTLTGSDGATLATTQGNYAPATVADLATAQLDLDSLTDGGVLVATTIATLSTQVSFTLTDGSADDNAYNRKVAIIIDVSTATQIAVGKVLDYTGSTKTVRLSFDPGVFMMAATDKIVILSSEF